MPCYILKIHLYRKDILDPSRIWKYKKGNILVAGYLNSFAVSMSLGPNSRLGLDNDSLSLWCLFQQNLDPAPKWNIEPAPHIILPPFPANFQLIHNPGLGLDSTGNYRQHLTLLNVVWLILGRFHIYIHLVTHMHIPNVT